MFPLIIKCPNCSSLFKLNNKPSKNFCCPKCRYKTAFDKVLNSDDSPVTQADHTSAAPVTNAEGGATACEATKVVNFGEKTMLVPGLQQSAPKTATLHISFKGVNIGKVDLPKKGNYNLGRRSSDSRAQIKLAPDMTMSRLHAAMRTVRTNDGRLDYQITTIKSENPVCVNGLIIEKGKICSLKPGDRIHLGETVLTFKLD